MEFHETGIKWAEFAILGLQKHQFGLVIPCPNQASAPGGEKHPETPKSTSFYQNSMEAGEIPLKSTNFCEKGVNRAPGGPTRPRASQNVAITMLFADFRAALPRARLHLFWFFHAKSIKFLILWIFHEKVEFSIKIMESATLAPQKHQFGLDIPCPNRGSAPGGGKVPGNTKNHQF